MICLPPLNSVHIEIGQCPSREPARRCVVVSLFLRVRSMVCVTIGKKPSVTTTHNYILTFAVADKKAHDTV